MAFQWPSYNAVCIDFFSRPVVRISLKYRGILAKLFVVFALCRAHQQQSVDQPQGASPRFLRRFVQTGG